MNTHFNVLRGSTARLFTTILDASVFGFCGQRPLPEGIGERSSSSDLSDSGTTVHACLKPYDSPCNAQKPLTLTKDKPMHLLHAKSNNSPRKNYYHRLQILLCTVSFLFTPACSSLCHRTDSIRKVANVQSEVLRQLQVERTDEEFLRRLRKDPVLSNAERHLQEALRAFTESTEAVKAAL